ncbi:MAG: hypothetical protein KJ709_09065 [Nanoarchaeota archaeon]|nr:hypothetical protein [Nanoarchaeota archaeon]
MKKHILSLFVLVMFISGCSITGKVISQPPPEQGVSLSVFEGIIAYGEEDESPSYRLFNKGIIGIEETASNIGGQPDWIELAPGPGGNLLMATLDESHDVNAQLWDGETWLDRVELTSASKNSYHAFDAAYESRSGDAMVVYTDLSGLSSEDMIPRYNIYDGKWSEQLRANSVNGFIYTIGMASNPVRDEMMLVTNDIVSDLNVQVWDGDKWGDVTELTSNSYNVGQPFDIAYESLSGRGLIAFTDKKSKNVYYAIVEDGVVGEVMPGPDLKEYGRMFSLIPDPKSDGMILLVLDHGKDTHVLLWDGQAWEDLGEVATSSSAYTFMSMAGAYEASGDAVLVYSDSTNVPKYRILSDGKLSEEYGGPQLQNIPRWMEMAANPNTDEMMLVANTFINHIDTLFWDGDKFHLTSISTSDTTSKRGGVAVAYLPKSICGNGVVEEDEDCDLEDLGDQDCALQGFDGGELACGDDCSLYTSSCWTNSCGESDDGIEAGLKGVASGIYLGEEYSYTDSCLDVRSVVEYFCGGDMVFDIPHSCPFGTECDEGACV